LTANGIQRAVFIVAGIAFAVYFSFRLSSIIPIFDLRDYQTYYYAAKAFSAGENPYDVKVLSHIARQDIVYPFVYPKFSLVLFLPLILVPYQVSALLYISLKSLSMIVLAYLWVKYFVHDVPYGLLLALFLVTAFHETILRDFVVGNVSTFEQAILWIAFVFFLQDRIVLFCLCVVASALLKTTSSAFLLLPLLLARDRKTIVSVFLSLAFLGAYHLFSYSDFPGGVQGYFGSLARLQWEGSYLNPSSFAVLRDAIKWVGNGSMDLLKMTWIVYGFYALAFCTATFVILRKGRGRHNRGILLLVAIFLYALLLPRFKDYSYILLVLPAVVVIRDLVESIPMKFFCVALVCVFVTSYQPFYAALVLYLALLVKLPKISDGYSILRPGSSHPAFSSPSSIP
jgi:hypothetical protein